MNQARIKFRFIPGRVSPIQEAILESLEFGRQDIFSLKRLFFLFDPRFIAAEVHDLILANILELRLPCQQIFYSDDMASLIEFCGQNKSVDLGKWWETIVANAVSASRPINPGKNALVVQDKKEVRIIADILREEVHLVRPNDIAGRIELILECDGISVPGKVES